MWGKVFCAFCEACLLYPTWPSVLGGLAGRRVALSGVVSTANHFTALIDD